MLPLLWHQYSAVWLPDAIGLKCYQYASPAGC